MCKYSPITSFSSSVPYLGDACLVGTACRRQVTTSQSGITAVLLLALNGGWWMAEIETSVAGIEDVLSHSLNICKKGFPSSA